MKFLFATVVAISSLFLWHSNSLQALSKEGCDMNCQKCHSINSQELKEILQKMKIPDAEVQKVQLSPVNGLWEVSVTDKGKNGVFYVDFSKQFLIPGPIIELQSGKNKTLEHLGKLDENRRVDFSRIPLQRALVMGNSLARLKVAVFTDPECQFCEKLHKEMEKVLQERKDVAFYIILFPLKFHKDAYWKSKSIMCKKSLKMLEDAFAQKPIPQPGCDTKEIDSNIKLAEALGITGTPTLVLPDGRIHSGTMPANQLLEFIQGNR